MADVKEKANQQSDHVLVSSHWLDLDDTKRQVCHAVQDYAMKLAKDNNYCTCIKCVEHDFKKQSIFVDIKDATLEFVYTLDVKNENELTVRQIESDMKRDP